MMFKSCGILLSLLFMLPVAHADDSVFVMTSDGQKFPASGIGPPTQAMVVTERQADYIAKEEALRLHADTLRSVSNALDALYVNQKRNLDYMARLIKILKAQERAARSPR